MWMATTPDNLELPIAVCDTAEELAKVLGTNKMAIYKAKWRTEHKVNNSHQKPKVFYIKDDDIC